MSYLENLAKFKEAGFRVWEILCATEVSTVFTIAEKTNVAEGELSTEDAETIISFVYDWVMSTEATANELCYIIKSALSDGELTIADFDDDYDKCRDYINNCF